VVHITLNSVTFINHPSLLPCLFTGQNTSFSPIFQPQSLPASGWFIRLLSAMLCGGFIRLLSASGGLAEWRGFSPFFHHEEREGTRSISLLFFFFVVLCLSSKVHPPSLWWVVIGDVLRGKSNFCPCFDHLGFRTWNLFRI